jgi:hypothetical protein
MLFIVTVSCEIDDVPITAAVRQSPFRSPLQVETYMQDEKALKTTDAASLRAWLEGVGGNLFVGEGKIKSVKISKKGNKLTLVVKKNTKKAKMASQPTTA